MPKPFNLLVQVEEIALGPVMSRLQSIPGIISVDMVPGRTKSAANGHAPNGHANGHDTVEKKKPVKRFRSETPGRERLIQLLKKGPTPTAKIQEEFEKEGRKGSSVNSLLHLAKADGTIQHTDAGYVLTKKGRDRARYV